MKKYLYRLFQWIVKGIPVVKVPVNISIRQDLILQGRKMLITGGSQGIGYHIAQQCVMCGADVVIVGRNEAKLKCVADELKCKSIKYDLTDIEHLPNLLIEAASLLGGLDALVNNAGICNIDNGFLNVSEQSYDEQFLLNVKSPFFLTQAFVKYVTEKKMRNSSVVFITSERGLYPDDAPYGMTKAAIGNIIQGIARQFATKGVHINGVAPGVVADTLHNPEKNDDIYLKGSVGKRFIMPQEIAQVVVWLLSPESQCISGEIIPCNQCNHLK